MAESKNNDNTKTVKELQKELLARLDMYEALLKEDKSIERESKEDRKSKLKELERKYSNEPWFAEFKSLFDRLEKLTEFDNLNFETEFNYVEIMRKEILEMDEKEKVIVSLKVGEAKQQRDVGRSIARMDSETMKTLGITVCDVVQIEGKKPTAAKAWPAYPEDQGLGIIRIDGFIRKNCSVSINEFVTVNKANAEYATSVKLAPVDIRISVDNDFIRFVKDRLIDRPATIGDTLLIMMLGHSVPFNVVEAVPDGIIMVGPSTDLSIDPIPISDIEERDAQKRRLRFRCLKEVEKRYAADETWFYISDLKGGEPKYRSMDETEIIKVAKSVARVDDKIVEIRVELFERRGSIEPEGFMWAKVSPSGKVRYIYSDEFFSYTRKF